MRPHGVIFFSDSARRGILDLSAFLTERGELRYSIQLDSRSNGSTSPGLETLKQIIPICQMFEDSAELTVEQLVEKFISAASAAGIRYKKPTLVKREKRFMLFFFP